MPRLPALILAPALLLALSAQSSPKLGYDPRVFEAETGASCPHADFDRCIELAPVGTADDLAETSSSGALLSADAVPSLPYRIAQLLDDETLAEGTMPSPAPQRRIPGRIVSRRIQR